MTNVISKEKTMQTCEKYGNARRELGLTQEEFARVFDVSPRTVIRWENGHSEPQGAAAKKMSRLLQILEDPDTREEMLSLPADSSRCDQIKAILIQSDDVVLYCAREPISPSSRNMAKTPVQPVGFLSPILPQIAGLVAGATTVYGAYKMLAHAFKDDARLFDSSGKDKQNRYQCPVCHNSDISQLLHCTGMLADKQPCTFVVCRRCVYSSRNAHAKLSPTCDCLDVPAFEPVEIKK
ncbi:MAG: helix-turn-helix domain-containing protein [Candidatus Riflebacteria bacterium]